jgi:DNA primase
LDAARVGPGGVALIGSSVSEENASKIAGSFHVAFLAFDNDKAGREATEKITQRLMSASTRARLLQGTPLLPISSGKDLGDMSDDEFKKVFSRAMKDIKRAF